MELGFQQKIRLKWPNDILYDGRKLGGFLIEMLVEANGAVGLVIGVGINVRMNEIQGKSIDQKWTDLYSIDPNISLSRNQLAATLIQRISEMLASFGELGFAAYRNEWLSLDSFFGKAVDVHLPDGIIAGIENGVDESGALCVLVDGQERRIYSGDVSLRIKDFV